MTPKLLSQAVVNLPVLHAPGRARWTLPAAFLSVVPAAFSVAAQTQMPPKSSSAATAPARNADIVHVIGFDSVKHKARGSLQLESGQFSFTQPNGKAGIDASSIQFVSAGSENQEVGGVPLALGKMAVPYGGDRVESEESQTLLELRAAISVRLPSEVRAKMPSPPIFRAGDRRADAANDLAVIHLNITKFSPGSETVREVTTVAGATKITVRL